MLKEEVEAAIKQLKQGKSGTIEQKISAKTIQPIDEKRLKMITAIFSYIYRKGIIPKDWLKSKFITISKKTSAKKYEDHRTLSLMSYFLRLFWRIIHTRIYIYI